MEKDQRLDELLRLLAGLEIAIRDELRSTRDEMFLKVLYTKKASTNEKIKKLVQYGIE